MLSEQNIDKLKTLIETHGGADQDALLAVMDDISRVIGTQALLARNLRTQLENAQVGLGAINGLVQASTLQALFANLSPPKRNDFTMEQAKSANEELVARVNAANDFSDVLKGVIQVAKVFI
jgi:hypothetical protein